jgi:small subunit ribosomal protein S5
MPPARARRAAGGMAKDYTPRVEEEPGFEEQVVKIYRCACVVKGGRRFSFGALAVVGDRNGHVGLGYGKANEVPPAVEKAMKIARRSVVEVSLAGNTIPHRVVGRYGASKVVLVPASPGTGVIAGASPRAVLEMAGVRDVLTKSYGSTSPKNLVKATMAALRQLRGREAVETLRGVKVAS